MLREELLQIQEQLLLLGTEGAVMLGALLLLGVGVFWSKPLVFRVIWVITLLAAAWLLPWGQEGVVLNGALELDAYSHMFRLLFLLASLWIVFFPLREKQGVEYYFLMLALIAGSLLMLSASHLLVIFLAVELASFSGYLLTNFHFQKRSFEAGMKYLLFGGVSAAVSLYGASLIYGFTGTLALHEMNVNLVNAPGLLQLGVLAFVGGLLFKVSVVPFHIWVPAAYQEAPAGVVALQGTLPKLAGFLLLHRVILNLSILEWPLFKNVLAIAGIATIVLGTLGALNQTNIKRLVAYGAIAHSGFLMAPLVLYGEQAATAFLWYGVVYTVASVAIFYVISVWEKQGITELHHLDGQGRLQPFWGILTVIILLALIGLPPTAGFTAKFYLFSVLWSAWQQNMELMLLVYLLTAVGSVVLSLYFYLKIPYHVFLKEGKKEGLFTLTFDIRFLATIFSLVLLWLFFSPEILNKIAENINFLLW